MASPSLRILTFGDSQAEVLDYAFHDDARYVKDDPSIGWRSGWSARDLTATSCRVKSAVQEQLRQTDRAVVFLAFGSADIERDLALHCELQANEIDTKQFLQQMVDGLMGLVTELQVIGQQPHKTVQVVLCFPLAPLQLAPDYARRTAAWPASIAPRQQRMRLWKRFINMVKERAGEVPVVDMTPIFEAVGEERFTRQHEESHQPDFTKTQHCLCELICQLQLDQITPTPTVASLKEHVRRPIPNTAVDNTAHPASAKALANNLPTVVAPNIVVAAIADVSVA